MLRALLFFSLTIFLAIIFISLINKMECSYVSPGLFKTEFRFFGGCFIEYEKNKWVQLKYFRVNGN